MMLVLLCVLTLTVVGLSRADDERYLYGDELHMTVPRDAQYLAFTGVLGKQTRPLLLWNKTNPTNKNEVYGKLDGRTWKIDRLTPTNSGLYQFKNSRGGVVKRHYVLVNPRYSTSVEVKGDDFEFKFILPMDYCSLRFIPEDSREPEYLIEAGEVQDHSFEHRLHLVPEGSHSFLMMIDNIRRSDAGGFLLMDKDGNDASYLTLRVADGDLDAPTTIGTLAGVVSVVTCCCCGVVRCCCKMIRSSKTNTSGSQPEQAEGNQYHDAQNPDNTAAAPQPVAKREAGGPVHRYHPAQDPAPPYSYPSAAYHSPLVHNPAGNTAVTPQPAGASVYPYQPTQSFLSQDPAPQYPYPSAGYLSPMAQNDNTAAAPQPEVSPPGAVQTGPPPPIGAPGLSTDDEPRFELKGLSFSASPLGSDSSNVYTSSKLNFL